MPPNANAGPTLRNRIADKNTVDDVDPPTESTLRSSKGLKGNEIAIEGVIYDIAEFVHPGGNVIRFFGGNDVTVQYKMIHPYHTVKHMEKMKVVGRVVDYVPEYKFDTPFEREIKTEVFKIVRRGREYGTPAFFVRAFAYVALFFFMQHKFATATAFANPSSWGESGVLIAIVFGVSQAFIGLNVQHDANHGAASKRPWINDLLGFGADHAYTNHSEKDPDSFSSEPVFAFNDYPIGHPKRKWWHKFQGVYFLLVLSLYWLSMVFNPQVLDLRHAGAEYVGIQMKNDYIVKRRKYAIALRVWYLYLNIYCPIANNGFNLNTIGIIMLMGVSESLVLAVLFSLSHNFEHSERDPTAGFRNTGEPVCWFKSQVESSSTYGGVIAGSLTGGLNFQVEHHLFPRMSSAHYPYIAHAHDRDGVQLGITAFVW